MCFLLPLSFLSALWPKHLARHSSRHDYSIASGGRIGVRHDDSGSASELPVGAAAQHTLQSPTAAHSQYGLQFFDGNVRARIPAFCMCGFLLCHATRRIPEYFNDSTALTYLALSGNLLNGEGKTIWLFWGRRCVPPYLSLPLLHRYTSIELVRPGAGQPPK